LNLLDRYIFKAVALTSLGAVSLFAFLLILGNTINDLLGYLLVGHLSFADTGELILLLVPFVVSYALPMGVLTGVLLVLGRLSADSEVTAMRASGIGLKRVARPVLLLGVLGAIATLYVNFESMPWARTVYDQKLTEAVRSNPLRFLVPRTYIRDFPGFVVYVDAIDGEVLHNLMIYEMDDRGRAERIVRAEEGRLRYERDTNEFILTLARASIDVRNDDNPEDFSEVPNILHLGQTNPVRLSLDSVLGRPTIRQKLQWMTYGELQKEYGRISALPIAPGQEEQRALDLMKVSLTINDKFNLALAVFSFAFVGVPLGVTVSRRETSANLGLAVVLALGYYFLTVMVGWLDQFPEVRPDLLLWVPNLIFLSIGFWLFQRLDRH